MARGVGVKNDLPYIFRQDDQKSHRHFNSLEMMIKNQKKPNSRESPSPGSLSSTLKKGIVSGVSNIITQIKHKNRENSGNKKDQALNST